MTIEHRGRSITAAPVFIKTYDSQKVLVTPAFSGFVGKSVQFVVDASSSGEGNLEIAVNANAPQRDAPSLPDFQTALGELFLGELLRLRLLLRLWFLRLPIASERIAGRLRRCIPLYPGCDLLLEATLVPCFSASVASLPFLSLRCGGL